MVKILFILFGVLVLAFVAVQIFAMSGQRNIETYPYEVEKKYDTFEVRQYEASLFTAVELETGTYEETSSRGFSVLAGYIFGGNETEEKIAMTAPVTMSLEDSMTMMFMVPKQYDKETLPQPDAAAINFREEPARRMAAITFGGWANDEKIEKYKAQLQAALEAAGIPYTNRFYFFGYSAPYEVFGRRNEVVVELPGT